MHSRRLIATGAVVLLGALALPAAPAVALPPTAEPRFVQAEVGWYFAVARTEDGAVYTWGAGTHGQLGDGSSGWEAGRLAPAPVVFPGLAADDPIVDVAAGADHALAVSASGALYGWGDDEYGQAGDGGAADDAIATPGRLAPSTALASGERFVAVAAGSTHSLALTSADRVFAWGSNDWGESNWDSWDVVIPAPQPVGSVSDWLDGDAVADIDAGNATSYVLTEDGRVLGWGFDYSGYLGVGYDDPYAMDELSFPGLTGGDRIVQVSGGDGLGLAVSAQGRVYSWGDNWYGQLGVGIDETDESFSPIRVAIPGLAAGDRVIGVSAGVEHALAVTAQGEVYAWGGNGDNQEGLLGLGVDEDHDVPTRVPAWPAVKDGSPIVAVSAAIYGSAAVSATGGVYTWGEAATLGSGNETKSNAPVNIRIGDLTGSVAIDGAPVVGGTLTAEPTGWPAGTVLAYSWTRDGAPIDGATGPSYLLTTEDADAELAVAATATAENRAPGSAASDAVLVGEAPGLAPGPLAVATAGSALRVELADGGTAPVAYSLADGEMPDGVTLTADGAIEGAADRAGEYRFTVEASNAFGSTSREYALVVEPGVLARLALTAPAAAVAQGGSLDFTVAGWDALGNPVATEGVVLTSSVPTDLVEGLRVTFPHASPHVVTAALGAVSDSVEIEVRPAAELVGTGVVAIPATLGVLVLGVAGGALLLRRRRA